MISERTRYFEPDDLAFGWGINRVETLPILELDQLGINDAIEYYEIKQYFDSGTRSRGWTEEQCETYKAKSETLYKMTLQYFGGISNERIIEDYSSIEQGYQYSFWALFEKCKLYKIIDDKTFNSLLQMESTSPIVPFEFGKIVNRYDKVLKDFLLEKEEHIEIIFSSYENSQFRGKRNRVYLPESLSTEEILTCFEKYINGDTPNINRLKAIEQMKNKDRFQVTNELRLMAKRRYDKEVNKLSKNGLSIHYGYGVSISPEINEDKKVSKSGAEYKFIYGEKWLKDTLDYPSILNNFIYVFEYVDFFQFRCALVHKRSESDILIQIIMPNQKHLYPDDSSFKTKNQIAAMQMGMYYEFLKQNNIELEKVFLWFFTEYLHDEFGCSKMRLSFPTSNESFGAKCDVICNTIESAIKQFSLFVKHGDIDFDLLRISSGTDRFEDIPSLNENKYVYGEGSKFETLVHLLFSNQCMLTYVKRNEAEHKWYESFTDLITKEEIHFSDFNTPQQDLLQVLIENQVISIDENGIIRIVDWRKIGILKDLWLNDTINRFYYPEDWQELFERMVQDGLLKYKTGLLSNPEADYFDYMLNNAKFTNGLQLRNKQAHGIQQSLLEEEEHRLNYMYLLQVFMVLIIKMNDDFMIAENKKY